MREHGWGCGRGPARGSVAGVIPSSGLSTRMGTAKALLDAEGTTFIERVAGALAGGGCSPVLCVLRDDGGPMADAARAAGARVVLNLAPEEGPITSLRAALRALAPWTDVAGCALCPVDHPLVRAQTVGALLEAFHSSGAAVVVPSHGGRRGHPVVIARRLFPELLEDGLPEGARTVLRRHVGRTRLVAVDDPGVVADIDTPAEYGRAFPEAAVGGRGVGRRPEEG